MTIERLGNYSILAKLADGFGGVLYRARDDSNGRKVDLRILGEAPHQHPEMRDRLNAECQSAGALRHPRIAGLLDWGVESRSAFIVAEAVEGSSLESLIAEKISLPIEKKIAAIIRTAEALGYAHERGVLHQGLSPAEIWLSDQGDIKITGFVGAHLLTSSQLAAGAPCGTRIYIAPEQIEGKPADARTDLFSLGMITYELLTFLHPFQAPDCARTLDNILHQNSLPTIDRFPDLPLGLWPILERCLAKRPDDRYATIGELLEACNKLQKDIADDRQLMLVELHTILPRLSEAAQRSGVPDSLKHLQRRMERLLASGHVNEYMPLNRMVSALAEHYRTIHDAFERPAPAAEVHAPTPFDFLPLPSVDEPMAPGAGRPGQDTVPSSALRSSGRVQSESPAESEMGIPLPEAIPAPGDQKAAAQADPQLVASVAVGTEDIAAPLSRMEVPCDDACEAAGKSLPRPGPGETAALMEVPEEVASHEPVPTAPPEVHEPPAGYGIQDGEEASPTPAAADVLAATEDPAMTVGDASNAEAESQTPPSESHMHVAPPRMRRHFAWAAAGIVGLLLIAAGYWGLHQMEARRGLFVVLGEFRDHMAQRLFGGKPRTPTIQAAVPQVPGGPAVAENAPIAQVPDVLIEQARILSEQGRTDEARVFAQRALELQPEYPPALAAMGLFEVDAAARDQDPRQEAEGRRALANAAAMISAGRLRQAKAEIDRAERLLPGLPEIQRLRERLAQKNDELAREQEEKQIAQAEAARSMEAREGRARRIQELYGQGRYSEARFLLDESLSEVPNDPQAMRLQSRANEALRSLSLYEAAVNARKYQDAEEALALLEQANPADPNLADMHRRLDSRRAAARANLSIYRLRDAGTILLDGQPVGSNGEVINHAVGIGSHQITLRTERGSQASQTYEFGEGQNVHIVYDATLPIVRLMLDTDRTFIAERKIKEEVHRFEVEHSHGLLRGSCEGELLISYYEVVFNPRSGSHGFRMPFSGLRLRSEGNVLRLVQAANSREVAQFRTVDPSMAAELVQLWSKLKALER